MSTDQPSPLGRYDTGGATDERTVEVRLLRVPVRLLVAGRAHHDELMHEFAVLAVAEPGRSHTVPQRLLDLIETLGHRYGAASNRPDTLIDQALADGIDTLDLTYQVPAHVVDAADQLEALLAEADEFCRSEQLLTLPRPPLLRELAHWYLDEFRRQIAGEPPQPWPGPLDP
ncbi:MAG: hypothetical protein QOJ32_477 [Frankiaceae bacterium]|jgi:hypothetical protein|nr:hypothetical protein [Frankiaceae bacterium]MDQ1648870.1 hypothetical protein [Frankiaceae bacterium]